VGMLEKHGNFLDDYFNYISNFENPYSINKLKTSLGLYMFWNRDRQKQAFVEIKRAWIRIKLLPAHVRLQSFLFSFVLVFSGASNFEILMNEMYLWRLCRTIATTIVIFSFEFLFINRFNNSFIFSILFAFLITVSILITTKAYSRMCSTLFSLTYVTEKKICMEEPTQ
ncbi:MAG: hypothetical protein Q8J97_10135, partial [Flavobacteriaceae bacterium]|nr:hypothetical protein [Flavobacteriaceae bacterium]